MATAKVKYNAVVFTVEGRGRFPIDMLRYDRCAPVEQKDSETIQDEGPRVVALRLFYPVGGEALPTVGRWRSFGWSVCTVDGKVFP